LLRSALALAVALGALTVATASFAQQSGSPPGAVDRRAAADAYDNGTRRFMQRDFTGAASWFETADRMAPSSLALRSAIRAHREAGGPDHFARAATIAVRLRERYPLDPEATQTANRTLDQLSRNLVRVRVQCTGCEVEIDQTVQSGLDFFTTPGHHTVLGHMQGGARREQAFDAVPGAVVAVVLDGSAPTVGVMTSPGGTSSAGGTMAATHPGGGTGTASVGSGAAGSTPATGAGASGSTSGAAPLTTVPTSDSTGGSSVEPPPSSDSGTTDRPRGLGVLPFPIFLVGAGLTVAGVVVTSIFWAGARSQGDALIQHAGMPEYSRAQLEMDRLATEGAEGRTTAFLIGTIVLGAASGTIAVFTRWPGGGARVTPTAGLRGVGAVLEGRF